MAATAVISAGGTSVSVNEYRLAYDRQINQLSQRFGQRLTREQATALGVDNLVLSQLVSGALLSEEARALGLGLSKDRIAALTAEDPAFHGPDGKFNRQQFEYVLREVGMRPEDYLGNRSQEAIRRQIIEAVADGMKAPDTFLRAVALYGGEDRTAEYIALPKSTVEPIEPPGDAVLSTWFEERKPQYAAPEYRKIAYVKLAPEDIADESAISRRPGARRLREEQGSLHDPGDPHDRAVGLRFAAGGRSCPRLAEQRHTVRQDRRGGGQDDGGCAARHARQGPDLRTRRLAEAAFALPLNEVSEVVDGSFGPVLVRVTAINPRGGPVL